MNPFVEQDIYSRFETRPISMYHEGGYALKSAYFPIREAVPQPVPRRQTSGYYSRRSSGPAQSCHDTELERKSE